MPHVDLGAGPFALLRFAKELSRDFFVHVFFAAVGADLGGNFLDDQSGGTPLQRYRCFSRSRFPVFADWALHGFLLLKPGFQRAKAGGSWASVVIRLIASVPSVAGPNSGRLAMTIWPSRRGGAVVFEDDEVADVQGRAHRVAGDADDEATGFGRDRWDGTEIQSS